MSRKQGWVNATPSPAASNAIERDCWCATAPKPCGYHEGFLDGWDAGSDDAYEAAWSDGFDEGSKT